MPQTFNVVLNSTYCTTETASNPNTNKNYYIDWSARLPKAEYELTFSFVAKCNFIQNFTNLPCVNIDLLSQGNTQQPLPNYQSTNSNLLGTLFPSYLDPTAHIAFLRADQAFNPSIYLANRPYSNLFNVLITNGANPPVSWVDEAATPATIGAYVLILHFKVLKLHT